MPRTHAQLIARDLSVASGIVVQAALTQDRTQLIVLDVLQTQIFAPKIALHQPAQQGAQETEGHPYLTCTGAQTHARNCTAVRGIVAQAAPIQEKGPFNVPDVQSCHAHTGKLRRVRFALMMGPRMNSLRSAPVKSAQAPRNPWGTSGKKPFQAMCPVGAMSTIMLRRCHSNLVHLWLR